MTISRGRIALLIGLGAVALGIFVLIFFFKRQLTAPTPLGNEINAAGAGGVQFTFGGESNNVGISGGRNNPFFQPSSQNVSAGVSAGNAFLPRSGGAINVNGSANTGLRGAAVPNYLPPSFLSGLINAAFPFGLNASSALNVLSNVGSFLSPQDAYTKSLLDQYRNILAEQQKLSSLMQSEAQSAPTIPPDLIQGTGSGQVTLSLSAIQGVLNKQASTTATFNGQVSGLNGQLLNLLNTQISQAQSAGAVSPQLQSAIDQFSQFNGSVAALNQQSLDFNAQATNLLNQTLANSSGTISLADAQNLLAQFNASTTAIQAQMTALQNQATNLTNSLSSQY